MSENRDDRDNRHDEGFAQGFEQGLREGRAAAGRSLALRLSLALPLLLAAGLVAAWPVVRDAAVQVVREVVREAVGEAAKEAVMQAAQEAAAQAAKEAAVLPRNPDEPGEPGKSDKPEGMETFVNSMGMEFALIPAGTFQMGCGSEAERCADAEKPRHEVTISRSFYLGRHEVTQAQWELVMGENPSKFKGPRRPVDNVSWEDAREFIRRLNAREGHRRYRLPTEAEWEYAARAGTATAYSFRDDKGQWGDYAWYDGNSGAETHPVGEKRPNAWGLFDMHGNVWEWAQDWKGPYTAEPTTDPQGPETGERRVLRGGSWSDSAGNCRSAFRGGLGPDVRGEFSGFRLALSVEE